MQEQERDLFSIWWGDVIEVLDDEDLNLDWDSLEGSTQTELRRRIVKAFEMWSPDWTGVVLDVVEYARKDGVLEQEHKPE